MKLKWSAVTGELDEEMLMLGTMQWRHLIICAGVIINRVLATPLGGWSYYYCGI